MTLIYHLTFQLPGIMNLYGRHVLIDDTYLSLNRQIANKNGCHG